MSNDPAVDAYLAKFTEDFQKVMHSLIGLPLTPEVLEATKELTEEFLKMKLSQESITYRIMPPKPLDPAELERMMNENPAWNREPMIVCRDDYSTE